MIASQKNYIKEQDDLLTEIADTAGRLHQDAINIDSEVDKQKG